MSVSVFNNKKYRPTEAEVEEVIGSRFGLWQEMIRYIREKYPSEEDFRFLYGNN